jgi:hypothetical protein
MGRERASRRIDNDEARAIVAALKAAAREVFAALVTPAPKGERGIVAQNITVDEAKAIVGKLRAVADEVVAALKD